MGRGLARTSWLVAFFHHKTRRVRKVSITRVVAIGGLDPTGGAGLLRDEATARALGARATLVGTAWTRQTGARVAGVEPRDPGALTEALMMALEDAGMGNLAVKIGLLPSARTARAVAAGLRMTTGVFAGPVVLDPVLSASSGGTLVRDDGARADLHASLADLTTLITPNRPELAALTGRPVVSDEHAIAAARALCERGFAAVLVKGGHREGDPVDHLVLNRGDVHTFSGARMPGPTPRGTGCALATAIAVNLAAGAALPEACETAKRWLESQIQAAEPADGGTWHLPG
jgi:hydroxymethylpyrimidine/phosphomethylpyrimidine kinase